MVCNIQASAQSIATIDKQIQEIAARRFSAERTITPDQAPAVRVAVEQTIQQITTARASIQRELGHAIEHGADHAREWADAGFPDEGQAWDGYTTSTGITDAWTRRRDELDRLEREVRERIPVIVDPDTGAEAALPIEVVMQRAAHAGGR